jgi:hypothetical protein
VFCIAESGIVYNLASQFPFTGVNVLLEVVCPPSSLKVHCLANIDKLCLLGAEVDA